VSEQLVVIPLDLIDADYEWNCRKGITDESVGDLYLSIREHGMEVPVVLRLDPTTGRYFLVSGFRRLWVARMLGFENVAAFVREMDEYMAKLANWRENGDRDALSFYDECVFIRDTFDASVPIGDIQKALNKNYHWARPRRQLWELSPTLIDLVKQGVYTARDISEVLKKDPAQRISIANAADEAQKRGEDKKGTRKASLKVKRVRGRKPVSRLMNIIADKALTKDPAVHQILLWVIGDLTKAELAARLNVDPGLFTGIEE
jgi:ParB/RepB/Spo0J family partition protein